MARKHGARARNQGEIGLKRAGRSKTPGKAAIENSMEKKSGLTL
jgi:hypothetical protein